MYVLFKLREDEDIGNSELYCIAGNFQWEGVEVSRFFTEMTNHENS